jgi:MFS family permease
MLFYVYKKSPLKSYALLSQNTTGECTNIVYDPSVQKSTLVTQFDLICDREWLSKLSISCGMLGIGLGAFVGGFFTDSYGRKRGIYIMTILSSILMFSLSYSPNIWVYIALWTLSMAVSHAKYIASVVYSKKFIYRLSGIETKRDSFYLIR